MFENEMIGGADYPGGVRSAGTQYRDNVLKRASAKGVSIKGEGSTSLDMGVENSGDLTAAEATKGTNRS